jgi:hypothetical protein
VRRHTSAVLAPASCSRNTPIICSSLKRLAFIRPSPLGEGPYLKITGVFGEQARENITPEYLFGFFQQHTAVQATNATKDYIGKWKKVAGRINDVISTKEFLAQVTFERQQPDQGVVYMYFRGPWKDRAIILKKGDNITVAGQISQISPYELHLDNCEIV